jgi:hypothetical protein
MKSSLFVAEARISAGHKMPPDSAKARKLRAKAVNVLCFVPVGMHFIVTPVECIHSCLSFVYSCLKCVAAHKTRHFGFWETGQELIAKNEEC